MVVWLIPVKGYAINIPLGFQLQAYRVAIVVVGLHGYQLPWRAAPRGCG